MGRLINGLTISSLAKKEKGKSKLTYIRRKKVCIWELFCYSYTRNLTEAVTTPNSINMIPFSAQFVAFYTQVECIKAHTHTGYPKKYAHGFVVLCFVVVMQSFIMNSHEVFIHIHQGCFAGTGAIVRLPQCQWSKPDGYGKISQCITTTKQKPCAYFLGYTVSAYTHSVINSRHLGYGYTISALRDLCEMNPLVSGGFPLQRLI